MLLFSMLGFFTTTFVSLAAFVKFQETKDLAYGKIGLRSYFHCGSGKENDPYVITRPRHLFNLSRLQSLGIFPTKTYFRLGYQIDKDRFGFYKGDTSEYSPVLDMTDMPITSIGSEATPFYGVFDGNGMTIANLRVNATLEDSGMFGYVASAASVGNFLLDDILVQNNGYTKDFDSFYSEASEKIMKKNTAFHVTQGDKSVNYTYSENTEGKLVNNVDSKNITLSGTTASFFLTEQGTMPQFQVINNNTSDPIYSRYSYSLLSSDLFLGRDSSSDIFHVNSRQDITPIQDIFSYFDSIENSQETTLVYPLNLSITISSVAGNLDSYGINHAKVISALNLSFEKKSKDSEGITMYVQPRDIRHGNNIGLVVGHLDGSLRSVFVHNGTISLNGVKTDRAVSQKSMTGFVGLVGPSVTDRASENAKGDVAIAGKDVGVLDFTDIYRSIIGNGTFRHETAPLYGRNDYYSYTPLTPDQGNEYYDYLRYKETDKDPIRYTDKEKTIGLIGKTIIKDDDSHNRGLGVFQIATDYLSKGYTDSLFARADKSRIIQAKNTGDMTTTSIYMKEDATHVFYSTFEYAKENISRYPNGKEDVVQSISNPYHSNDYQTNRTILPGLYIPTDSTSESQSLYESYYNYLFRFSLNPNRNGFYFNDLDVNTIGGKFLSDYLRYKLVDGEGNHLSSDSSQFGLMVKNKARKNIEELTTVFPLDMTSSDYQYVFHQDETKPANGDILTEQTTYAVANSINFEIKTAYANVTVLASNREDGSFDERDLKGSILGVYKLGGYLRKKNSDDTTYIQCDKDGNLLRFDDPDYAMALPANRTISYFSYTQNGKVGTSQLGQDVFSELTSASYTPAISLSKVNGYSAYVNAPIFAHTFCLPKGRYCLGSMSGRANVYYICAQGQDDGDITMSANIYNGQNRMENIDFVKDTDTTSLFRKDPVTDKVTLNEENMKEKRLYLIFDSGNVTKFNAATKNGNAVKFTLRMEYQESDRFRIRILDGDLGGLKNLALVNYRYRLGIGVKNIQVDLFNGMLVSDSNKISYTR